MIRLGNMLVVVILCLCRLAGAQVTNSVTASSNAFVCTGSPIYENGVDLTGLNFGGAGTLAVAPASAAKGEFRTLLMFNLSNSVTLFNSACGSNHWSVSSISLILTSNYGQAGVQPNNPIFDVISGGSFVIEWMSGDDWVEGTGTPAIPTTDGVTWDSLPALLAQPHVPLCTNTYVPPGVNIPIIWPLPLERNFMADVTNGGNASFYLYAADNQVGYLFNSSVYGRGNQPLLRIVATPRLSLLAGYFTNHVFHLTGLGGPGALCQIQASTNLAATNWPTLGTATAATNGLIQFDDPAATNIQCFYRFSQ